MISGPTGGGRSMLIEAIHYDLTAHGIPSLYLGHEVSRYEFNERAKRLAQLRGNEVTDELRDRLRLARYDDLGETLTTAWEAPDRWIAAITERDYRLVSIDPLNAAAAALGQNFDNENHTYTTFYDRLIQPLVKSGVTVLLAENIGHDPEAKGRPMGASAKRNRADVVISCELAKNPSRLILKVTKARSISLPFRREETWTVPEDTQAVEATAPFRPTHVMEEVSRLVESAARPLAARAIREGVSRKASHVNFARDLLTEEGYLVKLGTEWTTAKAYRAEHDPDA